MIAPVPPPMSTILFPLISSISFKKSANNTPSLTKFIILLKVLYCFSSFLFSANSSVPIANEYGVFLSLAASAIIAQLLAHIPPQYKTYPFSDLGDLSVSNIPFSVNLYLVFCSSKKSYATNGLNIFSKITFSISIFLLSSTDVSIFDSIKSNISNLQAVYSKYVFANP